MVSSPLTSARGGLTNLMNCLKKTNNFSKKLEHFIEALQK